MMISTAKPQLDKLRPHRPRLSVTVALLAVAAAVVVVASVVILSAYFSGELFAQQSSVDPSPVTIYPIKYAFSCPDGTLIGAIRVNSTHAITLVSNATLLSLKGNGTSLEEVYRDIIHSDQFLKVSKGKSWIVTEWEYTYRYRPTVMGQFILLNRDGTIYEFLQPLYYYLDNHQIDIMEGDGSHTCPAG